MGVVVVVVVVVGRPVVDEEKVRASLWFETRSALCSDVSKATTVNAKATIPKAKTKATNP